MFVRIKKTHGYAYLQIVESRREGTKIRQRVLTTLGQMEALSSSGKLDDLARSLLKFTKAVQVIDAHREGKLRARRTISVGPALVFDRLWHELGIDEIIEEQLSGSHYQFSVERAIFLTVLHRLFDPGSDRSAESWKEDYRIPGVEGLDLQHLYRSMAWLGDEIIQHGHDPFSLRCRKDLI